MRKVLATVILLVLVSPLVASSEFPILDKQVQIRQAHLAWITATQEIRMQAAIEYVSNISAGQGTAELYILLADLQEQQGKIQTLTTHVALNTALRQLQQITVDFRKELRTQMVAYQGKTLVLLNKIQTAIENNETMLSALEDTYWTIRQTNELWIFDTRITNAQTILNTLTSRGYNTTEAQTKLDEIQGQRSELEAAYQARNQNQIHSVNTQIITLSNELREIVRNLQIQIPQEKKVQYWIHVGERAVNRTATIISELETLGINVTSLQQIHTQAEADLAKATDAFDANDTQGAIDALHDLKGDFIALRDAYRELILKAMITGDEKTKVEQTNTALDDTINGIDTSIEK